MLNLIRMLKAKQEGEYEKYWAKKLIKSNTIHETFNQYFYTIPSKLHVQEEFKIVSKYSTGKIKRVLVIGSGSLPLTSIHFCLDFNLSVTCLDIDSNAVALSQRLIEKLQIEQYFHFYNKNILDFFQLNDFDFIVVAAMAGISKNEKRNIAQHIAKNIDSNIPIIFRTAFGMSRIWFPVVRQADLEHQFKICDVYKKISTWNISFYITMN